MKTKALIPTLAVALLLAGAATAQAKWSYGNGESDLEVGSAPTPADSPASSAPRGSTAAQDSVPPRPAVTPAARRPTRRAPCRSTPRLPVTSAGAEVVSGGLLLQDGTTITPIATQTTGAPTKLNPPEQYFDFARTTRSGSTHRRRSRSRSPPGQIAPGNDVLIVQTGHSAYVTSVAQACPDQKTWSGGVWNTVKQGNVTISPAASATKLKFSLGREGRRPVGPYYTDCTIAGAFTAKVHYTLNTWPADNGVRVGLLVNNPDYAFTAGFGDGRAHELCRVG